MVAGLTVIVGEGTPTDDCVGVGMPVTTCVGEALAAEAAVGVPVPATVAAAVVPPLTMVMPAPLSLMTADVASELLERFTVISGFTMTAGF